MRLARLSGAERPLRRMMLPLPAPLPPTARPWRRPLPWGPQATGSLLAPTLKVPSSPNPNPDAEPRPSLRADCKDSAVSGAEGSRVAGSQGAGGRREGLGLAAAPQPSSPSASPRSLPLSESSSPACGREQCQSQHIDCGTSGVGAEEPGMYRKHAL